MRKWTVAVLVGLLAGSGTLTGCSGEHHPPALAGAPRSSGSVSDKGDKGDKGEDLEATRRALTVLRRWDDRRSAAYADADPAALVGLYTSSAGHADVALLRSYRERGVRVKGLAMQRLNVEVVRSSGQRLTVRVTERLARALAVTGHGRVLLPAGEVSTREVTYVRQGGHWVVARVSAVPPRSAR